MDLRKHKISDLTGFGTIVLAQTLLEIEQSNLTAGLRSRKIALDDLRDAIASAFLEVADYPSDTAWTATTTLQNSWTGTVDYIKRAGMVTVNIENIDGTSATANQFSQVPSAYWPAKNMLFAVGGTSQGVVQISTSGLLSTSLRTAFIKGSVTYPVIS